jgi:hypothetical protein
MRRAEEPTSARDPLGLAFVDGHRWLAPGGGSTTLAFLVARLITCGLRFRGNRWAVTGTARSTEAARAMSRM